MRSMTGFGRGESQRGGVIYRIELSSVNRKQQGEIIVSLPKELAEIEGEVRGMIAESVTRGRVTFNLAYEMAGESASKLVVDEGLAAQYLEAIAKISPGVTASAADLLRAPGVFSVEEVAPEPADAWEGIKGGLADAVAGLVEMREAEGANLKADLSEKLAALDVVIEEISRLAPGVADHYRKALQARLAESGLDIPVEDERLVKEIGIFADRCDISEELSRLASHLDQFRSYMDSGEPSGRSMDFLCQEIHREINTMGSKANHAGIAQQVVKAKAELEKIREQVQNIE